MPMKQVMVPPAVSWSVLGAGLIVALFFVWKSYEVITYIATAEAQEAAYYQVDR
jgi:hypothetical protein